jgi:hypothetical protein
LIFFSISVVFISDEEELTALILSRVRLKDVDVKVGNMKAEVEEMTRDRRNNILLHGLPYQVNPP